MKRVVVLWALASVACDPRCAEPPPPVDGGPPPGATLTAQKSGDGTGEFESDPAAIDCSTDCAAQVARFADDVTTVTLTAEPARDALFESWTCNGSKNGEPLQQVVTQEETVVAFDDEDPEGLDVLCTASFRQLHTLLVVFAGEGEGTVTGTALAPGGGTRIACPDKCTAGYFADESDTLTAVAAPGSVFAGWAFDCEGTDPTVTVQLDGDKNCEARFDLE